MTNCIEWAGHLRADGYGTVRLDGMAVPVYAHRFVYERAHGQIPDGMQVHHVCENRSCVNLEHLQLLTQAEHASFHFSRPRPKRTCCAKGHPYTPENTGIRSDGFRFCRICKRENWRRSNRRRAGKPVDQAEAA